MTPMLSSTGSAWLHGTLSFAPEKQIILDSKLKICPLESAVCALNPILLGCIISELFFNQCLQITCISMWLSMKERDTT